MSWSKSSLDFFSVRAVSLIVDFFPVNIENKSQIGSCIFNFMLCKLIVSNIYDRFIFAQIFDEVFPEPNVNFILIGSNFYSYTFVNVTKFVSNNES